MRIALISMPWSIFNRPSIQLAALKAHLHLHSDIEVNTFHPYLETAKLAGFELYSEIALSSWGGEALFAPLLYPEKAEKAEGLFYQSISRKRKSCNFKKLSKELENLFSTWLEAREIEKYDLVGFSICFNQLLPSLYLAKRIKLNFPEIKILFGGSTCSGELGRSIATNFRDVDYVISGEGEEALIELCGNIHRQSPAHPSFIDTNKSQKQLKVNELSTPDYKDYFKEIKELFPAQPFIPTLPIEFSRGCWWNKCTFCNLNIQWSGYRYKSAVKMLTELKQLATEHETLHFTFTDNALPPKEADIFFNTLKNAKIDFDFFAEIRTITEGKRLQLYREAGLTTVQVGIEALSPSLLKKINKGTTVIENVAMMKLCYQYGIQLEGNLIMEFPSSTQEEADQTLEVLDYLLPFNPLDHAAFFLGYGSPVYNNLADYGICTLLPHPKNRSLFPEKILKKNIFLVSSFRGERKEQGEIWKPVQQKINQWQEFHKARRSALPCLSYRDGGTFLILRQESREGPTMQHRLKGISRKIYLFCNEITTMEELLHAFPQVKKDPLQQFITDMCSKRLMFQENNSVISLAVPIHSKIK